MVWAWQVGQCPTHVQEQTGRSVFGAGDEAGTLVGMPVG